MVVVVVLVVRAILDLVFKVKRGYSVFLCTINQFQHHAITNSVNSTHMDQLQPCNLIGDDK